MVSFSNQIQHNQTSSTERFAHLKENEVHIYPAGMIGCLVAIGTAFAAHDTLLALLYSPVIVSGTALALMILPLRPRSRQ